eukprot:7095767-Pyramimonas_sp.AAC.1
MRNITYQFSLQQRCDRSWSGPLDQKSKTMLQCVAVVVGDGPGKHKATSTRRDPPCAVGAATGQ